MEARRKGGVAGPTGPRWRTWHGGTAELYWKAWEQSSIQTVRVEWCDCLSGAVTHTQTHTHTYTHSLLACLLFLFPLSPLHASLLHAFFSLKHLFFFQTHLSSTATFTSFVLSLFVTSPLWPQSSHCFHLCVPHLLAFSVTSKCFPPVLAKHSMIRFLHQQQFHHPCSVWK